MFGKYINESVYTVIYHLISDLVSYHLWGICRSITPDWLSRCTPIYRS